MRSLSLRPDDSLTILKDGFVNRFQSFGFPMLCYSSYEAPDYYLGRFLLRREMISPFGTCFCQIRSGLD